MTSSSGADHSNGVLIRRLLAMAWRYKRGSLGIIFFNVAMVAMTVGGLKFVGLGIDYLRSVLDAEAPAPNWPFGWVPPVEWQPLQVVTAVAGMVLLVAVVAAVMRYAGTVVHAKVMLRLVADLRSEVYAKLQRLSFRFYDGNESGSIINRVTSDVQGTRQFLDVVVVQSLVLVITLVVYVVYMVRLHPMLTVACLATTPIMWYLAIRFGRTVKPAYKESRILADNLVRHLSENVQGVHVVKGFERQQEEIAHFDEANAKIRDQRQWIFWRIATYAPVIQMLSELNLVVLLGYGGYLVMHGQIGLGDGLVVFAGLLQQFANQVGQIANITNSIQQSLTAAGRVFEVLDAPVEVADSGNATALPAIQGRVRFEHVAFGYDDGSPVLEDITFEAAPGEIVALLGATGSGKSSLLSLVPRFYDPWSGRVRIDGHDLKDVALEDLRRNIGLVFQESFLFSTTVAANIAFGHPEATREQIIHAAEIASAAEFIDELPDGYDTVVGERGTSLSGGQRQRLAIARAVLMDPRILLLDDATAAIDPETEHEIMAAMESAMEGRTTFIIAHRLSTLRRADRVIVLDKGRIVEMGTHDELMAGAGRYAEAAEQQVAGWESRRLLGMGGVA
ncbi:MAG: ABC transporter ATP-binding protein [Planctomycetota bacterium]|jgi:ATP-binding cassette subfamily B protein|nr:ABC transporter ATP-binding protein [Planctomycetota bacterium]